MKQLKKHSFLIYIIISFTLYSHVGDIFIYLCGIYVLGSFTIPRRFVRIAILAKTVA